MQDNIKRFCPNCGSQLNHQANFCSQCGFKLEPVDNTDIQDRAIPHTRMQGNQPHADPNQGWNYQQRAGHAQKKCKACGKVIPAQAKVCPYCNKKQKGKGGLIVAILIGFIAIASLVNMINENNRKATPPAASSSESSTTNSATKMPQEGEIVNSTYKNDYFGIVTDTNWEGWTVYSKAMLKVYDSNDPETSLSTNGWFTDFYAERKGERDYIEITIYDSHGSDISEIDFIEDRMTVYSEVREENWGVTTESSRSEYTVGNNSYQYGKNSYFLDDAEYGYDGFLVIKKGNYIAFIQPMSIGQDHVDEYIDVLFGSKMSEISYLEYEEVSARQLLDELENNALQAASTYMGKTLAIRGKLDNIDAQGEYISLIGEDDRWGFKDVQCYIEDDVILERVKGLSKGDIIIVCGEVTDVGEVMGYSVTIHDIQTAE